MHRVKHMVAVAAVLAACGVVASCAEPPRAPEPPQGQQPLVPRLTDVESCSPGRFWKSAPSGVEFSCATLTVPLDHGLLPGARDNRQIRLPVTMTNNANPPRGVLVWLNGGPGSAGASMAKEIATQLDPAVLRDYKVVSFSQRGTGPNALDCPELQATPNTQLQPAPDSAVDSCAAKLGDDRRFYASADTAADLEWLRQALGEAKLTLDGVSYGTLQAARYALAYPERVERLVLDSVVPHDGVDPFMLDLFPRSAEVLRSLCRSSGCPSDPAADLAEVVRLRHNGPELLDLLTFVSAESEMNDMPEALRKAARGDGEQLDEILDKFHGRLKTPSADSFSRGLNVATACQDMRGPWGGPASPASGRPEIARKAAAAIPDQAFFPFDRFTALENGTTTMCRRWPSTPTTPVALGRRLPPVPTLILAGERDLVTPLGWARQEAGRAPNGRLVMIPGAGHITQDIDAYGPAGRDAVTPFLIGSD